MGRPFRNPDFRTDRRSVTGSRGYRNAWGAGYEVGLDEVVPE